MRDLITKLFRKAPKGFVALPFALAAVVLVTVLTLPFFGNNANTDDSKGPVISYHDDEDKDDDEEDDANTDYSGDIVGDNKDEGDTESDDSQSGTENEDTDDSSNSGTSTDPSGSTEEKPDDSNDNGSSSGSTGNSGSGSGNSGSTGNTGNNDENSGNTGNGSTGTTGSTDLNVPGISISQIPAFSGSYAITLNNGNPYFATTNLSTDAYEFYSDLDSLGRCGVVYACLGPELFPTVDREDTDISHVKPSGWVQAKYDCVPGNALWNRSHLIAFSLAGETDNVKNLITGTQHMNQIEMQVYETQVLNYIKETGNHVLYRVTPMFEGNNLVATGVQMEAWSIEDEGETICFNVFIYNVQDGVIINYATGESELTEEAKEEAENAIPSWANYVVNTNSGKIHKITCSGLPATHNREYFATYDEALAYVTANFPSQSKPDCGTCKPKP